MSTHDDDRPVDPALVDEALRRVAEADPAAGATLDTGRLHATLAASTGVSIATGAAADAPETVGDAAAPGSEQPAQLDELAAARARRLRRTRWIGAAAAVAAFAAVGGGGYAIGAQGGSPEVAAAISLDAGAGAGAAEEAAEDSGVMTMGGTAPAGGFATEAGQRAADRLMPGWGYGGRQVFHGEGLSDETGEHAAWAFDAASVYSEATLRAVAEVFGVTGDVSDEYGLTLGPVDGSAANVSLSPDGMASVAYYDPTRDPWGCEQISMPDKPNSDVAGTSQGVDGVEAPEPAADCTGDAPSQKSATATAKKTLEDLGLDAGDYTFEVTTDSGAGTNVLATLVVDGQATQAVWSFLVMSDGVQSAYGPIAPVVELGDYDVISAADAVERLNDPRFSGGWGGVWPLAAGAREEAALAGKAASADEPGVPATPRAGDPIAWPVTQVAITSARLGVALQVLDDGASVLVPAYELSDDSGATWSVIAVEDDQLDLTR
ncbi:hypothetical protein [Cellulomonas palmilytica]|uniref:hypothetical protein n=1 Tax=Cellulomonas palmilytica TaxID=2608402 RepID=UPI001F254B64|nr:hypothetical protein [Cellulomonas palmilytica]UJP40876.1 hypothetical protein F1D97_05205 [Cellulomonas palmilytica]